MHNIRKLFLLLLLIASSHLAAHTASAAEKGRPFRFAVLQQPASGGDARLKEDILLANKKNSAFLVINGIKSADEPCSDTLYMGRKNLLNDANKPLIVSLAGNDWARCRSDDGQLIAVERLQRLRDVYFDSELSLGTQKLKLIRQSLTPRFRGFPENAYWLHGKILFATINLPAENNHYSTAAGRNNEFDDRLIANRQWLRRLLNHARLHKIKGMVLFTDGNPFAPSNRSSTKNRDGFLEVRKYIIQLTSHFPGKVLLVHGNASSAPSQITWRDNLGIVGAPTTWLEFTVNPASPQIFSLQRPGKKSRPGARR